MRFLFLYILFFIVFRLNAQELYPVEINSGGNYIESNKIDYSSSIGGLVANTLINDYIVTQGFQQPYNLFIDIPEYFVNNLIRLKAFPNPTIDVVYFYVENEIDPVICYIRIFDSKGNLVEAPVQYYEFIKGQNISLNLHDISIGTYIVQIISKSSNQVVAQIKIVKI